MNIKQEIYNFLRWSERYAQTDMVYLAKGGFWLIFGNIATSLISLSALIAFAHWFPRETYGAYRYILSIIAILGIFALPGMHIALVRAVARGYEGTISLCLKTCLKWALIGTGICLAISLWYFWHQNPLFGASFLIAAIFLPFIASLNLFLPFWQGKKKFDIQAKYSFFLSFSSALVLIPVIFLTDNLILIILAFFASRTFFQAILFKLTLKKLKNQETDRETISFGKHLTLMDSVAIFGSQIDKIIIWQFLGPLPVAIYSFAQLPLQRIQELIPIFSLALPKLSEKNVNEIKKGLWQKFFKLFLISFPLALVFILLAPYIYKILFPAYLGSIPYFQVLALTLILLPFQLLGASLLAEMKKKELYIIQFAAPILQIILFLVLAPLYEIWGIIFATLIAQIFHGGLVLYFFRKI